MPSIVNDLEKTYSYVMYNSMTRIICIAAPVAGSGKTITAVNLSAALAVFEKKALLVDCCPENGCIFGAKIEPPQNPPGLADALNTEDADLSLFLEKTWLEYLEVLPAGTRLKQGTGNAEDMREGEDRLVRSVLSLAEDFDFTVIDTPTAVSVLVDSGICAADELLIPLRVEPADAEHLKEGLLHIKGLLKKTARLKQEGRTRVSSAAILINCCDTRVEAEALLGREFFGKIEPISLEVCIPEDPRLHEAYWFGKPVVCHDIASPGAAAFLELAARWIWADQTGKTQHKDLRP
ncbi:MAG: ParA family protein [Desulfobacteraceae bacterium]|nr:ParA family protein [Desulfobacteraceae bacterium]